MIGTYDTNGDVHVEPTANPFTAHTSDDDRPASFHLSGSDADFANNILPIADVHGDCVHAKSSVVRFRDHPLVADINNDTTDEDKEAEEEEGDFFNENGDIETGTNNTSSSASSSLFSNDNKNNNRRTQEQEDEGRRSVVVTGTQLFRYLYSLGLLVFSVVVVMAALFTGQTTAAEMNIPPVGAFFIFWFLIIWLAMVS